MKRSVAMRAVTTWIAVAVLVTVAVWLSRSPAQDVVDTDRPSGRNEREVAQPTGMAESRSVPAAEIEEPGAQIAERPTDEHGLALLTIEVVAVDHFGVVHEGLDGLLDVTFAGDTEGKRVTRWKTQRDEPLTEIGYVSNGGSITPFDSLRVVSGRTQVHVGPDAYIRALGGALNGRPIQSTTVDSWTALAGTPTLRVVATWPPPITLDVRDRDSGARLRGVDVFVPGEREYRPHRLESAELLIERATSPVTVPQELFLGRGGRSTLFVRAPGYAARSIDVDPHAGGETLVTLFGGGDVEVFVDGDLGDAAAEVRLWDPADRRRGLVAGAKLDERRRVLFEGLTTGAYSARVEVGQYWTRSRQVLGSATVEVERGQTAKVRVSVEPVAIVPDVPLRGEVHIPAAWDSGSYSLVVALESPPLAAGAADDIELRLTRRTATSSEWGFDAGMVQPGSYLIRVDPVCFGARLDVPPGGTTQARIDVAQPANVLVRAIDAATGEPLDPERLKVLWNLADDLRAARSTSKWAGPNDPEVSGVHLTAPATRIQVSVRCEKYRQQRRTVSLVPGVNPDVEVRLRKVSRVLLRFLDGDREVASSSFRGWLVPLEGQGGCGMSSRGTHGWFDNAELGRYELKFELHPDYRPIEPREVVVREGEVGEITIELERRW